MLSPTFSDHTALAIRTRILKWLREHFSDRSHWTNDSGQAGHPALDAYHYLFPQVIDLASSGLFDDTAESVLLRVLKDMNNFGNVTLIRDANDKRNSSSYIVISSRLLTPLPDGVTADGPEYYSTENISALHC
jgi:hypothetical protein